MVSSPASIDRNYKVIKKTLILLPCIFLLMVGCTYDAKTKKTRFTPLGAGPHEMIDTIVSDVKECAIERDNICETKTAHDDYEESKIKSMTSEEFDEYVKKQQEKIDD